MAMRESGHSRFRVEPTLPNLSHVVPPSLAWGCNLVILKEARRSELKLGVVAEPMDILLKVTWLEVNTHKNDSKPVTNHCEDLLADVVDQFANIKDCRPDSTDHGTFVSRLLFVGKTPPINEHALNMAWLDERFLPGRERLRPLMLRELMGHLGAGVPSRLHTGFY
jgi:hypothetical protein